MPNLNKLNFYNGKPFNFIQLDDGTIYEKNDKIKDKIQSSIPELEEKMNQNLFISAVTSNSYCSKTYISYKKIQWNFKSSHFNEIFKYNIRANEI